MKPIIERIGQPTPEEVRQGRENAGLTQTQAAKLVSPALTSGYKTWASYEKTAGDPGQKSNHRAIPLANWELFLLLTNQHPTLKLTPIRRIARNLLEK
jgi:hypothetical protein